MMTPTTRKKLLRNDALILFVLFCGCCTSVLHGQNITIHFNTEYEPLLDRTVNVSMQTCVSAEENHTTSAVIRAAGRMSTQALCVVTDDRNISSVKLQRLHTQLTHIIQSALSFSRELNPQTDVSVTDLFASLDDLTDTSVLNLAFVENWLYLKFLPVLPYLTEEIVTRLSQMSFTCQSFQLIVKVLSREESLITDSQQKLIYTHLIHSYLSRTDTADPGCFSKITRINEWLQRNFGIFSKYATGSQLQTLYSHFPLDLLRSLSPSEVAKFAVTSGALNSVNLTNIIFDHLEEGDAFQNTDAFFWTLIQSQVKIISLKS
ncbi:uncharacterized protein LOC143746228 [Siphateles boraxobius]|uniref:uncharacterized protein LOC143746228 n=1 Tax=Siphateles boraxobius TaxID=180520 RepID=UPI004064799B